MKTDLYGFFRGSGQRSRPGSRGCGHPGAPVFAKMPKERLKWPFAVLGRFISIAKQEAKTRLFSGHFGATSQTAMALRNARKDQSALAPEKLKAFPAWQNRSRNFTRATLAEPARLPFARQTFRPAIAKRVELFLRGLGKLVERRIAIGFRRNNFKLRKRIRDARVKLLPLINRVRHALILLSGFRNPQSEIVPPSVFHPCSSVASHV
jgi:hypothetical protein